MITQQLLDYINRQVQLRTPPDQIKASLLASGWPEIDINQAMSALNIPVSNAQVPPQQPAQSPAPSSYYQPATDYPAAQYPQYNTETPPTGSKKILVIAAIALGALLLIGGGAFAAISYSKSRQANNKTAQPSASPTNSSEGSAAAGQLTFANKLKACEKYKGKFTHLLTGDKLDREITGLVENKCNYIEQMPNGGKMTCKYTQAQREAAANYYKLTATDSGSVSTETRTDPATGESKTITKVDGKEVENPLNAYLIDGTCVISGYQAVGSTSSSSNDGDD